MSDVLMPPLTMGRVVTRCLILLACLYLQLLSGAWGIPWLLIGYLACFNRMDGAWIFGLWLMGLLMDIMHQTMPLAMIAIQYLLLGYSIVLVQRLIHVTGPFQRAISDWAVFVFSLCGLYLICFFISPLSLVDLALTSLKALLIWPLAYLALARI